MIIHAGTVDPSAQVPLKWNSASKQFQHSSCAFSEAFFSYDTFYQEETLLLA